MRIAQTLALVLVLTLGLAACGRDAGGEALPGVRLGMSPRDIRDRFDEGGQGTWQTKVGGGAGASDDTVLEWTATSPQSRATQARFEFHLGMLVAIRAHLREGIPAERVESTPQDGHRPHPSGRRNRGDAPRPGLPRRTTKKPSLSRAALVSATRPRATANDAQNFRSVTMHRGLVPADSPPL